MKYKLFRDASDKKVEKAVNDWLASLPAQPTIHRSDTSISTVSVPTTTAAGKKSTKKVPYSSVQVWYD